MGTATTATDECDYGNPDLNTLVATGGGSTEPPHEVPDKGSYTPEDSEDDGGVEIWVEPKRDRGSRKQTPLAEDQDEGEALLQGQGFVVFHDVVQTLARHATS